MMGSQGQVGHLTKKAWPLAAGPPPLPFAYRSKALEVTGQLFGRRQILHMGSPYGGPGGSVATDMIFWSAQTCSSCHHVKFYFIFKKDFIYSFLDRQEGREKERERNISV